jgi:DNA-binding transcriptional ArsR family regulator
VLAGICTDTLDVGTSTTSNGSGCARRHRPPAPAETQPRPGQINSTSCTVQPVLTGVVREAALARVGRALADTNRRRILLALTEAPAYPGQLADRLGLTRSNVSNHLACLRGCGLVIAGWEGRRTRYELADPRLAHALAHLTELVLAVDPDAACLDHPAADRDPAGARR